MNKLVIVGFLALAFTTGFTCSKQAPTTEEATTTTVAPAADAAAATTETTAPAADATATTVPAATH